MNAEDIYRIALYDIMARAASSDKNKDKIIIATARTALQEAKEVRENLIEQSALYKQGGIK